MTKLGVTFRNFANALKIKAKQTLCGPKCKVFKDRNKNYNNWDLTS